MPFSLSLPLYFTSHVLTDQCLAQWTIKVVGLVATLAVTIQVNRLANKILASKLS
jgi:hypothetical protein